MSKTLNLKIKWLKDCSLNVNPSKTGTCILHKNSGVKNFVNVDGMLVKSGDSMNVLGVEFDAKLEQWRHVLTHLKDHTNLHTITIIGKFFTKKELNMLLTSNFYRMLYYNSEIWHLPTLDVNLK
jgi:hypothetical protein